MHIPLSDLLLKHRTEQHDRKLTSVTSRWILTAWAWLVRRPRFYQAVMAIPLWTMNRVSRGAGGLRWIPFGRGWTNTRDFPVPARKSFLRQWYSQEKGSE